MRRAFGLPILQLPRSSIVSSWLCKLRDLLPMRALPMPSKQIPKPAGSRFHRIGRVVTGSVTADDRPRITSMPSRHDISIVDVVSRRVCVPVSLSVLVDIVDRALWCQAAIWWRALVWVRRDVFMPSIVFFATQFLKESSANNESTSFH